ncbi:MAG: cadherin domain-containing protein [Alphaproteobacteria bacterium]
MSDTASIAVLGKDGYITTAFVLSIADVPENLNTATWSGTPTTNAAISETPGVTDQGDELATYAAVGTFKPLDADGSDFQFNFDQSKLGWWLFDYDASTGVISVKYELDYESTIYPPVVETTLWLNGTTGDPYTNAAGATWISHNFTLTILNADDPNQNDQLTAWSGVQPANFAISETDGVVDQGELTDTDYVAVATLTPIDADGGTFEYGIQGDQAYLFTIGTDGELKLKYNLDHESTIYESLIDITIWAHGTAGNDGGIIGDGTTWIPHQFTLSILNLEEDADNTAPTEWSGAQPTGYSTAEDTSLALGTAFGALPNWSAVATFTPKDADGTDFEYQITTDQTGLDAFYGFNAETGELWWGTGFNYESITSPNITYTIWARGITDGSPSVGAIASNSGVQDLTIAGTDYGGGWISTEFVISVTDVAENNYLTTWSGTPSTALSAAETLEVDNQNLITDSTNYVAIATFTPLDADGTEFQSSFDQSKDGWWLFDYNDSTGVLSLKYELDYESTFYPPVIDATLWLNGISGNPITHANGNVFISQSFTLTILDGNDANKNEEPTSWSGSLETNLAVAESDAVVDQGPLLATYVAIATFKPLDADGTEFDYSFDQSQAGWWLFDYDASTGVLSLKYDVDYESTFYPPVISATLWVGGASGGDPTNAAAAVWISHNFTLSITDINDTGQNDQPIEWSGTQTAIAAADETGGVVGISELAAADYVDVATFTPKDADGGDFRFALGQSGAVDYTWLFDIGADGILKLKYAMDYESTFFPTTNFEVNIWAGGTSGNDGGIYGAGAPWICQAFVLSVVDTDDLNDDAIGWSGPQPVAAAINETTSVLDTNGDAVVVSNIATLNIADYQILATFTPLDGDGDQFGFGLGQSGATDYTWMFDIGTDGVLKLKYALDYESTLFGTTNFGVTIWSGGLSNGAPTNDAAAAWISSDFVLSLTDINEAGVNDQPIEWSGPQPAFLLRDEDNGVSNLGVLDSADYIAVATFTPTDADGGDFGFGLSGEYAWMFDTIGTDGILKLKFKTDYESEFYAPNVSVTIWAGGLSGGAPVGAAAAPGISSHFVLSITDIVDEAGNDRPTTVLLNRDRFFIEETAGVFNLGDPLTTNNYIPVRAFATNTDTIFDFSATAILRDDDGNSGFEYGISGEHAWLFEMRNNILTTKYAVDYESAFYPNLLSITIWARGTDGGTPFGAAAAGPTAGFVSQDIVISIKDVNDPIVWSDTTTPNINATFNEVAGGFGNVVVGAYTAYDPDGSAINYDIGGGNAADYFSIDSATGQLWAISNIDYEKSPDGDGIYSIYIRANSASGDDTPLTATLVWNLNNLNDESISWAGVKSSAAISETPDIANQGELTAGNYVAVATLNPTDADGDGFEYAIDRGKDQQWLFDDIGSDGILRVRYALDYESAWYPPVVKTTIWGHGTAGGAGVGAGTAWLPHEFTLSIGNIGENDSKTAWSGTVPSLVTVNEDPSVTIFQEGGKPPVAIATFAVSDADGDEFEYHVDTALSANIDELFYFGNNDGILYLTGGFNYEGYDPVDYKVSMTIYARGTTGGTPSGDAVSDTTTFNSESGWITTAFVFSIANVNDETMTWSGTAPVASIAEVVDIANQQELTAGNYVAVATFVGLDADGDGFQYSIQVNKDQFWLFDIGSDGVLSLKYNLDYESQNWAGNVVRTTIWANGTAGGDGVGRGAVWISQNFALTILNGDDADLNDSLISWSGGLPTGVAVSETANVENQQEISAGSYIDLATLKALDDDGDGFQYAIQENKDQFWLFDIGTDGVLKLKYNLDHESEYYGNVVRTTIWATGTAGGVGVGDGADYISYNFAVTIGNLVEDGDNTNKTTWAVTESLVTVDEDVTAQGTSVVGGKPPVAIATFTPADDDGDEFEYGLFSNSDNFTIDSDGILYTTGGFNYESSGISSIDEKVKVIIFARGISGGAPSGDAISDTVAFQSSDGWISTSFFLSIADVGENIAATTWSGTLETSVTLLETLDVTNQGASELATADYTALATFKPLDADGGEFFYTFDQSQAGWWLFDYDTSTGILSAKYDVDYESEFYPPIISATLWVNGTSGNDGFTSADGAVYISHNFTVSIIDKNDVGLNDEPTTWSGTPPANFAISETDGVSNLADLTADNYQAVASFVPLDDDGNNFNYFIAGDQAGLFDIGNDGILKVKYGIDYETTWYPAIIPITIYAWGTDGGDAIGNAAAVSQNFVLSILNIENEVNVNEFATSWSGGLPTGVAISETAGVTNQSDELGSYIELATLVPLDADGAGFEYSIQQTDQWWLFDVGSDGVISLKYNLDYESEFWTGNVVRTTIWAHGTAGDTGYSTADGSAWISHNFALTILDINDAGQNDQPTTWSGTQATGAVVNEDIGTVSIAEILGTTTLDGDSNEVFNAPSYVPVVTFTPLDDDGSNFNYFIDSEYAWMFDLGTDGVLKLKYKLDYENNFHPTNIGMTIWAWGTDGGDPIGNGGAISQNFVLSIAEVNEIINDQATEWDGTQPSMIAVSETEGVKDLRFDLTVDEYMAVATFKPKDADGNEFQYGLGGEYADFFVIGNDGVLKLKFELDYESTFYDTTNFSATVWVNGTSGGTALGNAVPWISQNFVLSVVNIFEDLTGNDQPTMWSGTVPSSVAVSETSGVAENTQIADEGNYVNLATFTATDVDGGLFEFYVAGVVAGTIGDAEFFAIGSDGILKLTHQLDAESTSHPDGNYSVVIWARGTSGGSDPFGDALTVGNGGFITASFVLSVNSFNDELTEWSGSLSDGAIVVETNGVSNSATLTSANYEPLATFSATDKDGPAIGYTLSGADASFFAIGSDGVLKLKYDLDAEAGNHGIFYSVIITARGTAGGAASGDGATYLSHLFVVTIDNVNDEKTAWSGTPPASVAVNEQAGRDNEGRDLAPVDYRAVSTFSATDPDGNQFEYDVTGADASYFTVTGGILFLTREVDFESSHSDKYSITVWARGTSGGDLLSGATAGTQTNGGEAGWVKQDFVLSILDLTQENVVRTEWVGGNPPELFAIDETSGEANLATLSADDYVAIHTFSASDGDGPDLEYRLRTGLGLELGTIEAVFSIDESGVLRLVKAIDYESLGMIGEYNDRTIDLQVYVRGTSGGDPFGAALSDTATLGAGSDGWVRHDFTVTINNLPDANSSATTWSATPPTLIIVDEHVGMTMNPTSLGTSNYIDLLTTFVPTDPDGDKFQWNVSVTGGGDFSKYFTPHALLAPPQDGSSTWAPNVRYVLDYEDQDLIDINHKLSITIWVRGVSPDNANLDGDAIGAGTQALYNDANSLGWISHAFALSIANVDESTDFNNNPTSWSGTQPTGFAIDENNNNTLVATFAAQDADTVDISNAYQKFTYSLSGADANIFNLQGNGVMRLIQSIDYEGAYNGHAGDFFTVVVTATDKTTGPQSGTGFTDTVSTTFILTVNDVDESSTADGGTSIWVDDGNNDGIYDNVVFANLNYTNDDTNPIKIDSAIVLKDSFVSFTDPDGNQNQHHWYFIADDANDGTGHIMFDVDGDGTGNDQIHIFGDGNWNLGSPSEGDGEFEKPSGLANDGGLTHEQFLDLLGNPTISDGNFV